MKIQAFNKLLISTDKTLDKIPVLSAGSNIVALFIKVSLEFKKPSDIKTNKYHEYMKFEKSYGECIALCIPVIGNISVAIYRHLKSKPEDSDAQSVLPKHRRDTFAGANAEMDYDTLYDGGDAFSDYSKYFAGIKTKPELIRKISPTDSQINDIIAINPDCLRYVKKEHQEKVIDNFFMMYPNKINDVKDGRLLKKAIAIDPGLINFFTKKNKDKIKLLVHIDPTLVQEFNLDLKKMKDVLFEMIAINENKIKAQFNEEDWKILHEEYLEAQ